MTVQAYAYPPEEPDPAEFERFWRHMHGRLHRFVLRALDRKDADEIVQETMIRSYENWGRLDPSRDPWPWLMVVARRISADHVRARARREAHEAVLATDEGVEPPLDEHICARELALEVQHALRALPEHDRTVLAMHHFDEMSTAQIAELTGRTDNAVRQQLFRARGRLREEFRRLTAGAGAALIPLRSWLRRTTGRVAAVEAGASGSLAAGSMAACMALGVTMTGGFGFFAPHHAGTTAVLRATDRAVAAGLPRAETRSASGATGDRRAAAGHTVLPGRTVRPPRAVPPTAGPFELDADNPYDHPTEPNKQKLTLYVVPGQPTELHHSGDMAPGWSVVCTLDLDQAKCD